MDKTLQKKRAERFRELHHDPKLLVLPNIWDPLGAQLLASLGYPAVATASAAVSYANGYDDGEHLTFDAMVEVIGRIVASVEVPVTADIERGYAADASALGDRMRDVLRAGVAGINIEDSLLERGDLRAVEDQCDRIRAVRQACDENGVPVVINARTDTYLSAVGNNEEQRLEETITRARGYLDAGADCIYPITLSDIDTLAKIKDATGAPLNVYAMTGTPAMKELEDAGISRLSLGPGFLKASLTTMKRVAVALKNYESYDVFLDGAITNDEVRDIVRDDPMP
jgi:2-methylisocitrate lyase-like PEP mutase family enzyme